MCIPGELQYLREQAIPLHRQGEPPPQDQAGPGHAETKARAAAGVRATGTLSVPLGKRREQPSAPLPRRSSES